jgi:serine beta-lactamase-like protein LACTB, mitochondrial
LSGIRHYDKKPAEKNSTKEGEVPVQKNGYQENKKKEEFENKEYHIKDYYDDMSKSLNIFQNDELFFRPGNSEQKKMIISPNRSLYHLFLSGTKFLYTTHGWTLISAVVESIVKKPFTTYIKTVFDELGLKNTYLDLNPPLIYNRAR